MKKISIFLLILCCCIFLFGCTTKLNQSLETPISTTIVEPIINTPEPLVIKSNFQIAVDTIQANTNGEVTYDKINKTIIVTFDNIEKTDEPLEDVCLNLIGLENLNIAKNDGYARALTICLKNNNQIYFAYDLINETVNLDLMDLPEGEYAVG